jgi:tetratricopeptide (TPR) repeat protein
MASGSKKTDNAAEIDRLALAFAKEPGSKVFIPLAEEYGKAGMWNEAAAVLEDGLKTYPGFITAMVALGRAYEQMNQPIKAKAILEEAVKLSPDNLRAHRTLAKLYAAQGAKDATIRSCNVILAINPQDQEALSLRASFDKAPVQERPEAEKPLRVESDHDAAKFTSGHSDREPMMANLSHSAQVTGNVTNSTPATMMSNSEESLAPVGAAMLRDSQGKKSAVVTRLEQWLNLVQSRRRDIPGPPPSPQTSV